MATPAAAQMDAAVVNPFTLPWSRRRRSCRLQEAHPGDHRPDDAERVGADDVAVDQEFVEQEPSQADEERRPNAHKHVGTKAGRLSVTSRSQPMAANSIATATRAIQMMSPTIQSMLSRYRVWAFRSAPSSGTETLSLRAGFDPRAARVAASASLLTR